MSTTPVALALAACGGGAYIDVDTSAIPGFVERVEIITSKKHCHLPFDPDVRCDQMQGENFPRPLGTEDDIFTRFLTASVAVDAEGRAVFEIEPGFGVLPMVFAVARDGQDQPVGVAVMDDTIDTDAGAIVFRVKLDPAQAFFAFRENDVAGVVEWGFENKHDCIGVEPVSDSPGPDRRKVFIVPDDNPDCDSRADIAECEPLWFNGYNRDFESGLHCVVQSPHLAENGATPCVLGHIPTCADLEPDPSLVCLEQRDPFPLCVPGNLCGQAVDRPCPVGDETCLEDTLAGAGTGLLDPFILCKPPGNLAGDITPCMEPGMIIPRPPELGMGECKNVTLASGVGAFHADGESFTMLEQARFDIVDFTGCNVVLTWSGVSAPNRVLTDVLLYDLFVDGEVRRLAFPVVFSPEDGCGAPPKPCTFNTLANPPTTVTDTIFACAR